MKIYIRTSGGFANLQIQGEIDTSELPLDLANKAISLLTPENAATFSKGRDEQFVDSQKYYVRVVAKDLSYNFELDESSAEPEMLDLLTELTQEIIKRKRVKG